MNELVEIWKPVMGYEGLYEVSNLGRVRSYQHDNERILSLCDNGKGYKYVQLNNGGRHKEYIHRLVALHFISNPDNKSEIDHINGNPSDNRVFLNEDGSVNYEKTNLRWCSRIENMNNPVTNKRMSEKKIGQDGNHKTSILQFGLDGNFIKKWNTIKEACTQTGTNRTSISACACGKYKSAGGYVWKHYEGFFLGDITYTLKTRVA